MKKPSTVPVHHSIVVHDIPCDTDFDDVKCDLEHSLEEGTIKQVIILSHRLGKLLTSIRVDFSTSNFVTYLLKAGYVKLLNGRHLVKEYHLPSKVLTCDK